MQLMMGKRIGLVHVLKSTLKNKHSFISQTGTSKCDDVSCSEIIRALQLEEDPELEAIEERIESFDDEKYTWKKTRGFVEESLKAMEKELRGLREVLAKDKGQLRALKDGRSFTPRLTAEKSKPNKGKTKKTSVFHPSKKRKNTRGGKKMSSKRLCNSDVDDDEFIASDDGDIDSDIESDIENSEEKGDSDEESNVSDADSSSGSDGGEYGEDDDDEVTQELLRGKIKDNKDSIQSVRQRFLETRKLKKDADHALATLKKNIAKAQQEKNAFCSKRRSEFSKDVLKVDFRDGLKDLDGSFVIYLCQQTSSWTCFDFADAAAEDREPENFNPNQNIRDYDAIDLPVFTCSSRDYVRLRGHISSCSQVRGDGAPTCFTNAKDTGIPDLQQWCQQLTISSRQRSARSFLAQLKTFATSVQSYFQGIGDVTTEDRENLRRKWESSGILRNDHVDDHGKDGEYDAWFNIDNSNPFAAIFDELGSRLGAALDSMNKLKPVPKVNEYGHPVGIAPRLALVSSTEHQECCPR
ncbi:hypothetical protein C0992_006356 [Termitomyces sp. T32_za158]|nr:hypothetical protein C0992_006356 [Termitomyces sp. T32_za158]